MRNSGVLLHISSLPSPYGIGTMGESARKFIDFLKRAGVRFWQMLPVGPTGYGDSPYQSFSSFAGNPYFIDLDTLIMGGWLTKEEADGVFWGSDPARADYGAIWAGRRKIFEKVYERFLRNVPGDFEEFCEDHTYWLDAYADFMALKDKFGGGREDFPAEYRVRGDIRDVEGAGFYKMQQYFFYKQWDALRRYAHEQGILLIGDLPIYASADSSDVWAFPEVFRLNGEYRPAEVAGCPPDDFTPDGQRWGNPLYDWDALRDSDYEWWHRRLCHQGTLFDRIRIDHFRGFESFFVIDAAAPTAREGHWEKGPGSAFFKRLKERGGKFDIIAEDLGVITDEVREMLEEAGYPGMKVLQFAFSHEEESFYLPYLCPHNAVMYTGTHDNDTVLGWLSALSPDDRAYAVDFMRLNDAEGYVWGVIKTALVSPADTAVLTMQDILEKDGSCRMNTPGTPAGNWQWRMSAEELAAAPAENLHRLMRTYHRESNK